MMSQLLGGAWISDSLWFVAEIVEIDSRETQREPRYNGDFTLRLM